MKRLLQLAFLLLIASPAWGTTYYLAVAGAGGNDGNPGTIGSPWLSPNHALNCGDVIQAAASTSYSNANFAAGKWGTVTCAGGNNVAWLTCVTFDACKITSPSSDGMFIDKSYWGVQGWEVSGQTGSGSCFITSANGGTVIHHIAFANDIASGCQNAGFNSTGGGASTADYVAFVGDIAYNAAQSTGTCGQGFSFYAPKNSDTVAGTHLYMAGSFAWDNVDSASCNGSSPTDGEGVELDSFYGAGTNNYTGQTLVENNIFFLNGGPGIQSLLLNAGVGNTYIRQNTLWHNMQDSHLGNCGDYLDSAGSPATDGTITLTKNIAITSGATCHGGAATLWAYAGGNSDSNLTFPSGYAYSAAGHYCGAAYGSTPAGCPGGLTNSDPVLSAPADPGAPSCGSASSVPNCMATVISNFAPTAGGSSSYGYQIPGGPTVDPLFPAWLCNVNLPAGLVTMGCGNSTDTAAPGTVLQLGTIIR